MDYFMLPKEKYGARPHIHRQMKNVATNLPQNKGGNFKWRLKAANPPQQSNDTNLTLEDLRANNALDDLFRDTNHHPSPEPNVALPKLKVREHMLEPTACQKQRVNENKRNMEIKRQHLDSSNIDGMQADYPDNRYGAVWGNEDIITRSTLVAKEPTFNRYPKFYQEAKYFPFYKYALPRDIIDLIK